jgi:hypothetical protein
MDMTTNTTATGNHRTQPALARTLAALTIALLLLGLTIDAGSARQSGKSPAQEQFAAACSKSGGTIFEGVKPDRRTAECVWINPNGSSNSIFCVFVGQVAWYCTFIGPGSSSVVATSNTSTMLSTAQLVDIKTQLANGATSVKIAPNKR